jgi:tRNA A-37 threonylcarbamoyl transferase component Bud32
MYAAVLYFINWQRDITIERLGGRKVVVKKNKTTKSFHEFLLIFAYTLISIFVAHPTAPPFIGRISTNEGFDIRRVLEVLGIPTPTLISISATGITEEYVEGGNLYRVFLDSDDVSLAFQAGILTGRLHNGGYVFTDNKSQNYLRKPNNCLVRTDLGFIERKNSVFSQSMDIGSFLASIMDLEALKYKAIEKAFFEGYRTETKRSFPYLSIVLRNILSLGFASNHSAMLQNIINNPSHQTVRS